MHFPGAVSVSRSSIWISSRRKHTCKSVYPRMLDGSGFNRFVSRHLYLGCSNKATTNALTCKRAPF
eukprot:scaffold386337_cov26-Prasinocladus_malaysianus.AAC.1